MRNLLRRPVLAFVLGAALAAAAAGGTAAYAALADERVAACYAPKTGALSVIGRDGAPTRCARRATSPIDWSIRGPQGPAGVFSGTFTSPNGAYAISVTDGGIVLSGPGSAVRLTGARRRDRERRGDDRARPARASPSRAGTGRRSRSARIWPSRPAVRPRSARART